MIKECLHYVWWKTLLDLFVILKDFDSLEKFLKPRTSCVDLGKQVGFEEVETGDVEELRSHSDHLTTELLQ